MLSHTKGIFVDKNPDSRPARYASPALEKGLDILEILSREQDGLSLTEIARALGRSVNEVFRVLATLDRRGYLTRIAKDGRYRITVRLLQLALIHPPTERLLTEAMPVMREVSRRTQQSCHLGVRDNATLLIVAESRAPKPIGLAVTLGAQFPLLTTTSGIVLLAFEEAGTLEGWLAGLSPAATRDAAARGVPARLPLVRRRGFLQEPSTQVRGVTNVSYPILNHHGVAVAALTIAFLRQQTDTVTLVSAQRILGQAAGAISHALGHPGIAPRRGGRG